MTIEEIGKKFFMLFLALITMCLLGSFVVSLNVIDFVYLLMLYSFILMYYKVKDKEDE